MGFSRQGVGGGEGGRARGRGAVPIGILLM